MYPFDSDRGRIALGIVAASGGGMILTRIMEGTSDPKHYKMLQALLVFWLIFVAKQTLASVRQLANSQAAAAPGRQRAVAAGAAAAVGAADDDDDDESSGTPVPTRRRRTRRD